MKWPFHRIFFAESPVDLEVSDWKTNLPLSSSQGSESRTQLVHSSPPWRTVRQPHHGHRCPASYRRRPVGVWLGTSTAGLETKRNFRKPNYVTRLHAILGVIPDQIPSCTKSWRCNFCWYIRTGGFMWIHVDSLPSSSTPTPCPANTESTPRCSGCHCCAPPTPAASRCRRRPWNAEGGRQGSNARMKKWENRSQMEPGTVCYNGHTVYRYIHVIMQS